MRLRFRLLLLMLSLLWRKPMGVLDESVLSLRVLPNDVDIQKITNDRYIALMDLGRMDGVFRAGLFRKMFKNKWVPLATFNTIRFRYPLRVFEKYQLRTRVVWWDEKAFYFKQVFERKGRIVASGYVCATFLGASGPVSSNEILSGIGQSVTKPSEPPIVARLREIDALIHESQKE